MISPNVIRQSLKTLTPAPFLLLCCSIGAFAQSPSESQDSGKKDLIKITFRSSIGAFAQSPSEPQDSGKKDLFKVAFGSMSVKIAINSLVKQMGLNVVFDDTVKEDRLTIELNDITIEKALKIILESKDLQARIMEEKTLIVFPDNEAKRKKYEQYEPWPVKSDGNK